MPRHSVNVISLRRKQKVLFVDEVHEDAPIEEVKEASTGFSVQDKMRQCAKSAKLLRWKFLQDKTWPTGGS